MRIDQVDFFYVAMPRIEDVGDGSQDALFVRIEAGGHVGWGECEAAPLVSIASWICPMSHGACRPVRDSVLGQRLESVEDIRRICNEVRERSFDLLQTDHTLSGIDIAMWDLIGKKLDEPVYRLLGFPRAYPRTPYASLLFGDEPQETLEAARRIVRGGYRAAKFGWGPYGKRSVAEDDDHVRAAREGLGRDAALMVDAGTVWVDDLEAALRRLPTLQECEVLWLEEPFVSGALREYAALARKSGSVKLAGGEGCHNVFMAEHMIEHAGLGYVQIDTGRIGGITAARKVVDAARERSVTFVNHTFTTHLALSASLQPYAGVESYEICEYPVEPKPLARDLTTTTLERDDSGQIRLPEAPGLGLEPNLDVVRKYLVDAEIKVGGEVLYRSPRL